MTAPETADASEETAGRPPAWTETEDVVRAALATTTGWDRRDVDALPGSTALLGSGIALNSLSGVVLLTELARVTGVDVGAEDVNLDALDSIDTLVRFVAEHAGRA